MTTRKSSKRRRRSVSAKRPGPPRATATGKTPQAPPAQVERWSETALSESTLSLHHLFEQQTRQMLERSDLDEEQKQNILIAMSCPCCGAGVMSYTAKLKRR
ncbi:MAG: hypothetical protein E6G96_12510 [Alphaproteobacteria bacterium]|nr:MAG: hypothetical protein E6G96_12510 [Alphaproteobacteria bacterium]